MIAEFGLAALWLAAALAGLQLLAGVLGLTAKGAALAGVVRPAAVAQGLLCAVSFAALIWLFCVTDLSVKLVATNSHSLKSFLYKFAGTWGNHEGSMLLWITVMGLAGGFVALIEKRLGERMLLATLAGQAWVSLGFYAFLLFASNPFERLAARPRLGVPPADAVFRLCRAFGGLQFCDRRADHPRSGADFCAGNAALGAGGLDIPDAGDRSG
jgi:cytochrome c-type biogenesis protein CcmF